MFGWMLRSLGLLLLLVCAALLAAGAVGRLLRGPMLAFTSDRASQSFEIMLMDAALGTLLQVTSNGRTNSAPQWSPDGMTLAWLQGGDDASFRALDMNTFAIRQLTSPLISSPVLVWAPQGDRFLYERTASNGWKNILLTSLADGCTRNLTENNQYHESSPSWAPDGQRFVYAYQDNRANNRLAIYDLLTGADTTITQDESIYPSWSPDGEWIAYINQRGFTPRLTIMRPDGSGRRDLIFNETLNYVPPRWSADSRYLAFGFANSYLLVLEVDTDAMRRITPENTFDYDPAWSPDGRWLAVVETTLQRTATRVVIVDAHTLARRTLSNPSLFSADRMPAWRP